VPVRDLLARAGAAVRTIKPCYLMSPLSVAQFLKPSAPTFDLLVVDEASQMLPEDALGALLRADQMVVVGDPKQLPPTDFFDRYDPMVDEDDPLADEQVDAESILDLCRATFRPVRRLRWHYRSRHESLIAFANKEHYADQPLITFPAAERASAFLGLELVPIPGRYEGKVNEPEARAVLAAAVKVAKHRPDLSLAIVTVNQPQRELIEELVAAEEAAEPALAMYRERWEHGLEPLIVKNLENIQGDERDVVLVSLVYGPNAEGKVYQRFGPRAMTGTG
jgi:superfamily I DNA and/or RNA helicase